MREQILSRTQKGLGVFQYYIPGKWRLGRNFFNPLYQDTKASCSIYLDRRCDVYRMKDFGNDEYSGDCFFFVGKLKGLDCYNAAEFIEIMKTIDHDMSLGCFSNDAYPIKSNYQKTAKSVEQKMIQNTVQEPMPPKEFTIVEQPMLKNELHFWQEYGIESAVLKRYNVVSIREFESVNSEGKPFTLHSTQQEPIFGYLQQNFIKIYRPFSNIRFLYGGQVEESYCFGLEQLPAKGDILYITGGEKDVLSLSARGCNAICFNSETAQISHSIIKKLSFMFKHIVLLYDMDKTGLASSLKHQQQLSEFEVKRMLLPLPGTKQAKDISDFFRMGNTIDDLKSIFMGLLDSIYSNTISILKSCEVNFDTPPPEAQMVVSVNDVPLGTQGNLLCVSGGEGTGKSNFVGSLISGSLNCAQKEIDTLGITLSPNMKNKAVLLYDTEQSEVQLYKNSVNILRRAKLDKMPETFKAYSLTSMSRSVRLHSIIESMDRFYHYYGGIHMVVIDGIADLIRGANDEGESISIVEELYRLAGIYNTCIVCVLHFIPNGMKLRGHLGSELQRKAAAILSIERDDDSGTSVIKALKVRDGSPLDVPMIQFAWDKEAAMHCYLGEKPKEEKEQRKERELTSVAREIFRRRPHLTYNDLCGELQAQLDVKDRTAKTYIRFMRKKEIVIKDPSNPTYLMIGSI